MSRYLEQLQAFVAEKQAGKELSKLSKEAFDSFDSSLGSAVCDNRLANALDRKVPVAGPVKTVKSPNSSIDPDRALTAIQRLRTHGVAVTLDAGTRRPVLHGDVLDLQPDGTLDQLLDLAPAIASLLETERRDAAEGRRRFVNPVPWRWPADLDDALTEARQRNEDEERCGRTARYCICARLAENEWATSRGRVWICEPCREDRIEGLEILPSKSRRVL